MKILDKYLLKSFLITFATVFVILFFIFVLQVVWLFISELAGKDLDFFMIVKFLLFKMPSIIPLVLPLSVLLASIMTFGSLAENYEFAAMKSSGISLQRAMRSLIYFIILLSFVAFAFANNVIPYAEFKFQNFRSNVAKRAPAMAIAEGQFSQIGNYNIKVEKKSGKEGKTLTGVTIHKIGDGSGSNTAIKARSGELISSESSNILKLVLKDGNYYEDIIPKKFEERNKVPFAKSEFKRYVINIDLSKLNKADMNNEQITNTNTMLTIGELNYTIDSLQKNYNKDVASFAENINTRSSITPSYDAAGNSANIVAKTDVLQGLTASDKTQALKVATSNIDATSFSLDSSRFDLENKEKNISQHWIALYDKFVIAFSCLLMFFIGAPLGAIIRKGGLGLPIVFAILIFIIFHFINTFGKKVAQQGEIAPFFGCWLSSMVLAPLAIILTKKATDDKGFDLNFDWFTNFFNRFFPAKAESETENEAVMAVDGFNLQEAKSLAEKETKKEITILNKEAIAQLKKQYNIYSLLSIIGCFALLTVVLSGIIEGKSLLITAAVIGCAFYFLVYKSQKVLQSIGKHSTIVPDLNIFIVLLGAFPFYPLFYLYNRLYLREITSVSDAK